MTATIRRPLLVGVVAIALLAAVAIGVVTVTRPFAPPVESCTVDSLLSGCGTPAPVFAGTDCSTVGTELGTQLDARLQEIVSGPRTEYGVDRSVLASSAQVYFADRTNKYLRDNGLVKTCSADQLLTAIEPRISEPVRAAAPDLLARSGASFADWTAALGRDLRVVDQEEDAPYGAPIATG